MGYIPQHALANLKNYKYKGVDKSLLSNYVLNPFWTWFVTLWPTWVAPNTITLSGLSIVLFNFATLVYYDPTYLAQKGGATGPPQWVYFTWGIGLFLYQTFDAIDGKQARRTGMAGPLGEMFDHGCDAINTTLEVILASQALNLGRSWWTVASQIATLANFYLTTWEEYHTGQLYLGVFSGPVEGILMIVSIFIITGIYGNFAGPTFWDQKFLTVTKLEHVEFIAKRVPNVALNESFMIFGAFALAFNIITSYTNVYRSRRATGKSVFKPLLYLLPFPASALLQILWMNHPMLSNSNILHSFAFVPFLCAWGFQFSHQVGRMILAHVTGQPLPWWDAMWIWSIVGAVDANLPWLMGRAPVIQHSPENTEKFVFVYLAVVLVTYARFVILVIGDITNYLGIACLTVRKKDARGVWRTAQPESSTKKI
ncbi:Choline/ethanolaminephosphotransferase [Artomyces pyxidatus]|uniref:Choline/ethanolaminephosphotransferase n=1 Tax=Artomyces pyxidatus TaxID=48021 RepID=A0ACB8TDP4_9AGAM|nr:Choline/ethanolaminephosphotransferase [Artomyces pyxidatus]